MQPREVNLGSGWLVRDHLESTGFSGPEASFKQQDRMRKMRGARAIPTEASPHTVQPWRH